MLLLGLLLLRLCSGCCRQGESGDRGPCWGVVTGPAMVRHGGGGGLVGMTSTMPEL